jgi:DNA repair protein RecO (recombination protein O)
MQHLTDEALILKAEKFGDHDAILHLLMPNHGLLRGVVKGGYSSKKRADMQPGTVALAKVSSRLPEHLGSVTLEACHSFAARVMHDPLKLAAMGSMMSLLSLCLAEQDPHPELYVATGAFLQHVAAGTDPLIWLTEYVRLELRLLEEVGFGLDLSSCAATGVADNLTYVSPRSARAVCTSAGAPYAAKLLPLPTFLANPDELPDALTDIEAGLTLTGYFLNQRLLPALHREMPLLRDHFVRMLSRKAAFTDETERA